MVYLTTISPAKAELEKPAAAVAIPELFPLVKHNLISGYELFCPIYTAPVHDTLPLSTVKTSLIPSGVDVD